MFFITLVAAYTADNYDNVELTLTETTYYTTDSYDNVELVLDLGVTDTCTAPASGIWEVDCNDNCTIISDVDIGTNSIILAGTGSFTILANISAGLIAIGPNCELLNVPGDGKELRIKGG